jgi:hypothetical protein
MPSPKYSALQKCCAGCARWPVDTLSTVLQVVAFALLMTWGVWYGKRMRRSDLDRSSG